MKCNWSRWLWGIVPLLVLGWVAVQAEHSRIEADLRGRATLALTQAGMSWAATKFEGRDAILEGQAGDDAEPLRAGDLLRGVWGVRVVENKAELLPKVAVFSWSARRRGNRIRLMGHVPNRAMRMAIRGVAKANFPGFEVVDRMETARGISSLDAWLGGVGFGLKHLTGLKRGDVHMKNLDLWIGGEAEDIASYRAVKAALANNLPKGIKLTGDLVTAPVVSPFTWSAQATDGRLVLAGYVPGEAAHTDLLAAAKAGFGTMVIVDQMQPGEGAPKGWSGMAVASLNALARLQAGSVEMRDGALVVSGLAGDAATAEAARAALRAALPPSIRFTDQIKAKEPPPPPTPAPEPIAPSASAPSKGTEAMPPGRPERVGALPENTKANQSTAQPTISAAAQVASAADLRARACEDRLTGLVTTGQIAFEFASAELGRASLATLDKLAEAAKACPDMRIEVAGHASIEGSTEGNQHLSIRRAQSVVAYLIKAGVDSTQLQPVGYGATRPVAPNDTGENMAKNRRIEFMVRPK